IILTDVEEGKSLDLSGNNWGTESLYEIFAKAGEWAPYITVDGKTMNDMEDILVTNTDDSGSGSLREAIERAKVYSAMGVTTPRIVVSPELAGQSIVPSSPLPSLDVDCVIEGNGIVIEEDVLRCGANVEINNLTALGLVLERDYTISCEGLVLTDPHPVVLYNERNGAAIDWSGITFTAENPSIVLLFLVDGTLSLPPSQMTGGYKFWSDTTLHSGDTLTLEDGVVLSNFGSLRLTIEGTLQASYTEAVDVFKSSGSWFDVFVQNGGKLLLENANVNLVASTNWFRVQEGGTLEMTGGSVQVADALRVYTGGAAELAGVTLQSAVSVEGGALSLDDCVFNNKTLHVGSGSTLSLCNTSGISTLTIDGSATITAITGNDFTSTTLNLTNFAENQTIDLSGNEWGTDDINEIFAMLGAAANKVTIDGQTGIASNYFIVTNTNDSGAGSLRNAIAQANAYTGEGVPLIRFASSLAGQTIQLSSALPAISADCVIEGRGVRLSSYSLTCTGDVELNDITLPQLVLSGAGSVSGENITLTSQNALVLNSAQCSVDFSAITTTAADVYVSIYPESLSSLSALPASFSGGYRLLSAPTVNSGETLTLADGVMLSNSTSMSLNVYGTLQACYTETVTAFSSAQSWFRIFVRNGGKLQLENVGVNLTVSQSSFSVESGATLEMTGGSVNVVGGLQIRAGASASLTDVDFLFHVNVSGSAAISNCSFNNNALYVQPGASISLVNSNGLGSLSIDAGATIENITGNDFSNTTLSITNVSAGTLIDLSGNEWGTDDIDAIFDKLGSAAPYVVIDGYTQDGLGVFNVTNRNNSGLGSLRNALLCAASYTGDVVPRIIVNPDLSGQTISLSSALTVGDVECSIEGNGVILTGYSINNSGNLSITDCSLRTYITSSGSLSLSGVNSTSYIAAYGTTLLDGVTCTTLYVDSASDVSVGEGGVTLTGTEAIRLVNFSGNVDDFLDAFTWTAIAAGAYVGISGTLYTSTLSALPESFTGNYRLVSDVSVAADETVTVEDGVGINMRGYDIDVYGTLNAEYEEVSDLLTTTGDYAYLNIQDGGQVNLKNASLNIGSGSLWGRVSVLSGGVLNMEGGDLFANYYHVQIAAGGQATLVGTRVRSSINNSGTLSMMGVNSSSYIEAWGTTLLDGVTCTTLYVDSSSDVSTGENGVTLTGAEAFRLVNFSGNVGDLFDSLTLSATAAGAYVGISGSLNTSTLSVLPESLAGTYRLVSNVSVNAEQTVTVEEGVSINMQGYDLNVYGSLNAEYDEVSDLLTTSGDYAYLNIQDGGQMNLKNASLNIGSGSLWGRVSVLSGGVLNMEGGNLFANHYHVQIAAGGQATLVGTSVRSSITNSGMLSMTGVNSTSYIEAWGTTLLDGVTCTSLYVDSTSDVSVGEGGVTLTGTEALRLVNFSGNVGDFLDSLTLTATAAGAYVGISGTLYSSTLSALPESLTGNYRLVSNVSVAADETVTVEDGVSINMQGYGLNVDGTLNAEYDEVSDLLTTTGNRAYLYISDGGQVNLKNTSLNIGSNGCVSVLAGGSLNMEGGSTCAYITSSGSLSLTDVTSTSHIEAYGTTLLDGVTCTTLYVDSSSDVNTGENGVTLTGAEAIRLVNFSGDVETLLDSFLWNATSEEEKYVGLSGTFGNTTLSALPEGFTGDYQMRGNVTLQSGSTMTLAEGGHIRNASNYSLSIYGTLVARNETLSDALTSTYNGYVNINSGGQLLLENANVNMAGSGSYINIASGGVLEMNGGSLHAAAGVRNAGVAELVGVESTSYISNTGTLTLEDVSCTTLHVDSDCDVITRGTGVTLTGEEVLRLTNFSGSVETLFDSITWSATNTGVKYIGLSGNLGNATLSPQPEGFANIYKMVSGVAVNSGATVVLGDGVQLVNTSTMQLNINGTLQAAYSSRSAFISTSQNWCDVYVRSGGKLLLENADVDLRAGGNYFRIESGGTLEMTGGSVVVADGLRINSGATASLTGVIVESNLYVSNGATVSLTNSAVNATLSIDGRATITAITGNDFSNTTFSLSNFSSGQKIDLSGNYWGTDDITEIFAMLGSAAAYVTIDGIIEDTLEELTVSNTNDSGPGSLRNAILSLNSSSTIRDISIRMSEEVAGQTIVLDSALPAITAPCTIEGAGITLDGYGMTCSTDVEFKDITLPKITLSGTGSISGENIVLTNQEAVLLQNWSSVTSISGVTATAEGAYVGITGTLGDSTFTALPETLAGGYKVLLNSDVTIAAGKTVTLEEGVCWQLLKTTSYYRYLNVDGTLVVDNENVADALVSVSGAPCLRVNNGGKVQLTNANVTGFYYISTQSGGTFEMTGGTLDSVNDFQVSSGGTATLSGVTVKDYINNSGTLNMEGGSIDNYITSSGVLNMSGVVSTSYIEAKGATTLDGVTCTTLRVDSDADVSTGEGGVTLTGEEAIRLQNFSGNVGTLLDSFDWSTEAEDAYVGITGTLGDSTFTALPETLAGGYKVQLNSDVTIASGKTVTLEEGVCWQLLKTTSYYQYLYVNGTLVVDNETVADALVAPSGAPCLRIQNGGKVQLTNASVTGFYNINTQSGGTFEMTGGTLDSVNDFQVSSGGTATLSGVTVKDYINNSGTLNMEGCSINNYI
ncbi:MAG: hypothetical protein IIV41_01420, partial [Akkermansia sp.]|nr:hypothetical protein [Akkermansia sp.]